MCGIAGWFDLRATRSVSHAQMQKMNDAQLHRGPDEGGMHFEPGVALVHRRLSILDLSHGQQPLFSDDGNVGVVFNGEIYNFEALAQELMALGYPVRTQCDTEVIVYAWQAWGTACVERFRGMFAFAIYDRAQQQLFLARDRMGVKPLFYAELADGSFIFASELKALLQYDTLPRIIDPTAVEAYFALGYIPEPRSIYLSVHKLCAGEYLSLRRGRPPAVPQRYWDVKFTLSAALSLSDAETILRDKLREAVRLRMIADVPLGAFLSGGVDSSAVVAMMATLSEAPVTTCAMGFDDLAFNESHYAQMVADRYQTRHFCETVVSDDFSLIDILAKVYDEPYADSSAIPTYRVCQLARKHVTVALSGDGGDEVFGGYRRYRRHLSEEKMRGVLPLALRARLFGMLGHYYPKADWAPRVFRAKTTFQSLARDSAAAYFHSVSILRDEMRAQLFSAEFQRELNGYHALEIFRTTAQQADTDDPLAMIQYIDIKNYLVGDINTKVDRASMAHSLEVRDPLMDHELVTWMATLPSTLKIRGGEGKYLLKKTLESDLPAEVLYRKKMGFAVPLAQWFRGPLRQRMQQAVLGEVLASTGFFRRDYLVHLVEAHQRGQRDYSAALWALLMFDAFLRQNHNLPSAIVQV